MRIRLSKEEVSVLTSLIRDAMAEFDQEWWAGEQEYMTALKLLNRLRKRNDTDHE